MTISREDVKRVALLARLALTDDEVERLRAELGAILANVAAFGELDLAAIPPSAQVIPIANATRADVARPSLPREAALAAAPEAAEGAFRVPAVFEETP